MNNQLHTGEMNTLSACINKAIKDGYTENFRIAGGGLCAESAPEKMYAPDDVQIRNFYRFEGESNPDDEAVLYVIELSDGVKGTLIDAYGTYADSRINAFILQVHDIQKHVEKRQHVPNIPESGSRQ